MAAAEAKRLLAPVTKVSKVWSGCSPVTSTFPGPAPGAPIPAGARGRLAGPPRHRHIHRLAGGAAERVDHGGPILTLDPFFHQQAGRAQLEASSVDSQR